MSGPNASCWHRLMNDIHHARDRALNAQQVQNHLIIQLKSLYEREPRRCSRNVQGWLHSDGNKRLVEIGLKKSADAKDSWENPAIALRNLLYLEDGAALRFAVTVSERAPRGIRAYTVALEGTVRSSKKRWYGQVHLTEKTEGEGLCGHALLHCHMGSSPEEATEDAETEGGGAAAMASPLPRKRRTFSPRVPLPWLHPWEALEWLLATVDPDLEPAPV